MNNQSTTKQEAPAQGEAMSMDRRVARRRSWKRPATVLGVTVVSAFALFSVAKGFSFDKTYRVNGDSLRVAEVRRGVFEDYVSLRAQIAPQNTVYLDASEGGKVEKVHAENGDELKQGDLIVSLSNSALQLSVTSSEAQVAEQLNNMRTLELTLEQNRLRNKREIIDLEYQAKNLEEEIGRLAGLVVKGYVSKREYQEKVEEYVYRGKLLELARETQETDARMQEQQLAAQRITADRLEQNLEIARKNLDDLDIRAPFSGKLSGFDAQIGQNINRGSRLGQIDQPDGFKLEASIDEFYLNRVDVGQEVTYESKGKIYTAEVSKVYPQVSNGQFQVDILFNGEQPGDLRRGQSLQTRLTLGDSTTALQIPNGAFHQSTGGNWIYVLNAEGDAAVRRDIRLGRKNAESVEVLDGLDEGERVIISSYGSFAADVERLQLAQ